LIKNIIQECDCPFFVAADQIAKLAGAGVTIPQGWVRSKFGIPDPQDGEPVVGEQPIRAVAPQTVLTLHATRDTYQTSPDILTPDPIAPMTDRMDMETAPVWRDILATIQRMVDESESLPALRDALLAAYGDLPTDQLADIMAIGFAAANLAGRYAVLQESGQ